MLVLEMYIIHTLQARKAVHNGVLCMVIMWFFSSIQTPGGRTRARLLQFSLVAHSCPTLCDPMDCSTPGLPVRHQLPELAQTLPSSRWYHPTISSSVVPFSSRLQSFPASGNESALPMRWPKSWHFSWSQSNLWTACRLIFVTMVCNTWGH